MCVCLGTSVSILRTDRAQCLNTRAVSSHNYAIYVPVPYHTIPHTISVYEYAAKRTSVLLVGSSSAYIFFVQSTSTPCVRSSRQLRGARNIGNSSVRCSVVQYCFGCCRASTYHPPSIQDIIVRECRPQHSRSLK